MKYPNDFVASRNTPSAQGRRDSHVVSGDFRQRRGTNTVTKKKGDFVESVTTGGTQQVFMWYATDKNGARTIYPAEFDLSGKATVANASYSTFPKLGANAATLFSGRAKYIGDNFLSSVIGNGNDVVDQTSKDVVSWPIIFSYPGSINLRVSQDPYDTARGVSWIDTIQITGLPVFDHQPEMHASGWDASLQAYRYTFTFAYPLDAEDAFKTRAPVAFYGDTKNRTMTQTSVPFYPGRDNSSFNCFCIGPGRLQSLITVTEDMDFPTMIPPYLVMSADHGQTWSYVSAAFLDPYLYKIALKPANPEADPPTPEVREHFELGAKQLYYMAKYHINVYVGNGKNILIIPNGMTEIVDNAPKYAAMAFLGTEGGGYVRLSWPPDAWPVSFAGSDDAFPLSYVVAAFNKSDDLNGQFGFGTGCMYLSVVVASVRKLMVTYNFGATWEIKPYPAAAPGLSGGGYTLTGCVVKPYVSMAEPGELLFAYVNYPAGEITLLKTDGTFAEMKTTGAKINRPDPLAANNNQLYSPSGGYNTYLTNFSASKKPYIFPAYPGEFDKP